MNTRERVLKEALNCVNGEREKQYGSPEDNFRRIADLWSVYLTSLFEDEKIVVDIDPIDVAKMMILFKIARSNGDKDKLDNYVDMIGYGACAAEIFENGNEDKTDEYAKDPYSYFHNILVNYASAKAKDKNIPLDNLKSIDRKLPREFSDLLYQAAEDCVSEGKYGGLKLLDYYKEIDKLFEKYKPEINDVQVAEECKGCDYAEKCMGTGVCLKDTEKKCIKDKPDDKCNRKDCGQFDAYMTNYQHYIYNKTKEAREAIDECMCDRKTDYVSYLQSHNNISACIVRESSKANVNPCDVVDNLTRKGNAPTEMAALLANGKLSFDDVASYIKDTINKLKKEDKSKEDKEAEQMIQNLSSTSLLDIYKSISSDILSFSTSANVDPFDIIGRLTINGHAPTVMAELVLVGKLKMDSVVHYIEDAIHEVKEKNKEVSK